MAVLRVFLFLIVVAVCSGTLSAQAVPCDAGAGSASAVFTCQQGVSILVDFGSAFAQLAQFIAMLGDPTLVYTYSIKLTGGTLPPGLTLSPSGVLSGTLTTAGTFTPTITFSESLSDMGQSLFDFSVPEQLLFLVTPISGPPSSVDPTALGFNVTQGGAPVTQSVTISNRTNQSQSFSASASTNSGGNWLAASPSSGSIASFSNAGIAVTVDPSQLQPGTYSGSIAIGIAGGQSFTVSVLVVVTNNQPNIQLSQSGLRFQAVTGGAATPPQMISVLNSGPGTLSFTATASTISGGSWLSVSSSSSTSSSGSPATATVTVNPAGLQAGDYYGQVKFTSQNAVNSPQVASVVLNVRSPANSPGASVQPTGLIFVAKPGVDPASKMVSLTNPSPSALAFVATAFSNNLTNWITATPTAGSISATKPAALTVQPKVQGLASGIYTGEVVLTFVPADPSAATGALQTLHVAVLLVVLQQSGSTKPDADQRLAAGCTPTKLLPVFTQLGTGFTATAAWPTPIEVTVVDDCGDPFVSGSLTATFSSGDSPLALASLKDGRWAATWQPVNAAGSVSITAQAQELQPALKGSATIGGALQANPSVPVVSSGGVVSAASFVANQPLAPGAFAAIFGSSLSQGFNPATQLPLNLQLGGTSVFLAGEQLPLLFAGGGQVNAVIPYDIPPNTRQQLIVQIGSAISIPQQVVIASAQPAVFTLDGSGRGSAVVAAYSPDGTPLPAGTKLAAGDVIVIYCSGLGAVNPAVPAGSPAPLSPLSSTVAPVTVTIGGAPAPVLFAGLAPMFAQLYQVNVIVPGGLSSGDAVLLLSAGGQQSAPVTVPIQ